MHSKNNRFDIPLWISNTLLFAITATVDYVYLFANTDENPYWLFAWLVVRYTVQYRIPITAALAGIVLLFWRAVRSAPCKAMSKPSKWINLSLTLFSLASILGEIVFWVYVAII